MNTRVTKGRPAKTARTARRERARFTESLETVRGALAKGGRDIVAWMTERVREVRSGLERLGKTAWKTATRVGEDLNDEVQAVRKRVAGTTRTAPARKAAAGKAARKPVRKPAKQGPEKSTAAKKATPRRAGPTRRKAAAQKAPAGRAAVRKKAPQKRKASRAA